MYRNIPVYIILLLVLLSCTKDKEFDITFIQTGEVTNIDKTGATFHARISNLRHIDVLEYGFVWSKKSLPVIAGADSEKYVIPGTPAGEIISQRILTTLENDETYRVRAFIRHVEYVIYGKEVVFTSLGSSAPEIIDFFPKSGNLNDTLSIAGRNFSYIKENNKVFIGKTRAQVVDAVQDTLTIIIPDKLFTPSSPIRVLLFGNESVSSENFNLIPPVISELVDKTGTFGSQVEITGSNFLSSPETLEVFFDNHKAEIIVLQNSRLSVKVPDVLDKRHCFIKVSMNNLDALSVDSFALEPLIVNEFNPKIVNTGESIILTGINFSPVLENNKIKIGGIDARVVRVSPDELEVVVPLQDKGIYPGRKVSVSAGVLGDNKSFKDTLLLNDDWFRIPDFPGSVIPDASCFFTGGRAYVGLNDTREFWQFNPETYEWKRMNDFPGEIRRDGVGFCIGDKIYFGTGVIRYPTRHFSDFWCYDISTDSWELLSDVKFSARHKATGYVVRDKGYVSGGVVFNWSIYYEPYGDTWEYAPDTDSWNKVPSFSNLQVSGAYGYAHAGAVSLGETVYYGLGWNYTASPPGAHEKMFTFKPSEDYEWKQIASFPVKRYGRPITFVLDDRPYFCSNNVIFYFDGSSWKKLQHEILANFSAGIGFSYSGKVYIGLGITNAIWVYDPNR